VFAPGQLSVDDRDRVHARMVAHGLMVSAVFRAG
jgi:hypothetical protein